MKEILGRGQSSTCYRCVHRQSRTEYAVKVIKDPFVHDPSDEIQLLFHYRHLTHIVRVKKNVIAKKTTQTRMICISFRFETRFTIIRLFILSLN